MKVSPLVSMLWSLHWELMWRTSVGVCQFGQYVWMSPMMRMMAGYPAEILAKG